MATGGDESVEMKMISMELSAVESAIHQLNIDNEKLNCENEALEIELSQLEECKNLRRQKEMKVLQEFDRQNGIVQKLKSDVLNCEINRWERVVRPMIYEVIQLSGPLMALWENHSMSQNMVEKKMEELQERKEEGKKFKLQLNVEKQKTQEAKCNYENALQEVFERQARRHCQEKQEYEEQNKQIQMCVKLMDDIIKVVEMEVIWPARSQSRSSGPEGVIDINGIGIGEEERIKQEGLLVENCQNVNKKLNGNDNKNSLQSIEVISFDKSIEVSPFGNNMKSADEILHVSQEGNTQISSDDDLFISLVENVNIPSAVDILMSLGNFGFMQDRNDLKIAVKETVLGESVKSQTFDKTLENKSQILNVHFPVASVVPTTKTMRTPCLSASLSSRPLPVDIESNRYCDSPVIGSQSKCRRSGLQKCHEKM